VEIAILTLICVGGIAFMIRFFIALCNDGRRLPRQTIVRRFPESRQAEFVHQSMSRLVKAPEL
jgi:hypothetical protein